MFHELIRLLKYRDIPFYSLGKNEEPPAFVGVLICSGDMMPLADLPVVTAEEHGYTPGTGEASQSVMNSIIDHAIVKLLGKHTIDHIIIGVDPGKRPGLALVTDNVVLETVHTVNPDHAIDLIREVKGTYVIGKILVRVGNGSPRERNIIVNSLLKENINVEVVDETSTSMGNEARDINAAIAIARKQGKLVKRRMKSSYTRRQVKNIQDKSRIETDGELTISSSLAEMVAEGKITLKEAIKRQKGS